MVLVEYRVSIRATLPGDASCSGEHLTAWQVTIRILPQTTAILTHLLNGLPELLSITMLL